MKRAIITTVLTSVAIWIFIYVPNLIGSYIEWPEKDPDCVGVWINGFTIIVFTALVIMSVLGVWLSIYRTIKNLTSDEE